MAISATVTTMFGEDREVYIRLNNVEASNHGVKAIATFRGFLSADAFSAGAHFVWGTEVEFDCDVSQPIWPQAYAALATAHEFDVTEV